MMTSRVVVAERSAGQRICLRVAGLFLTFCCLLGITLLPASAQTPIPPARGQVEIGIVTDMANASTPDTVSIHIFDNTDRQLLTDIANQLGQRFKVQPTNLAFKTGDAQFIDDKGIGLDFQMMAVPRGQGGYLPLVPFIEVLAPYASQLRIVTVISGPYNTLGYEQYHHPDVSVAYDQPQSTPPECKTPVAFYSLHATINNPSINPTQIPTGNGKTRNRLLLLFGLLVLAGMVGASVGLLLTKTLTRWKTKVGSSIDIAQGDKYEHH